MQCSKSTDPVTSTPPTDTGCPTGQSKNAKEVCVVDATLCQNGQGKANACTSCDTGYKLTGGVCLVQNNLVISLNSLTMNASKGYTASFTLNTDQNWMITGYPAWLSVSPTSGGPGSAIQINLTTTTINTVAVATGSLSVNATGKPELNKTINFIRPYYDFCGGGVSLPNTNTVAILKWVSLGANEHTPTYSAIDFTNRLSNDPNGRLLVGIIRGCGAVGSAVSNWASASNFRVQFYNDVSFMITKAFDDINFSNSPIVGFSTIDNNKSNSSIVIFNGNISNTLGIYSVGPNDTGTVNICNGTKQYTRINYEGAHNIKTCIDDLAFPSELKDTMNTLLEGAGKTYRIP